MTFVHIFILERFDEEKENIDVFPIEMEIRNKWGCALTFVCFSMEIIEYHDLIDVNLIYRLSYQQYYLLTHCFSFLQYFLHNIKKKSEIHIIFPWLTSFYSINAGVPQGSILLHFFRKLPTYFLQLPTLHFLVFVYYYYQCQSDSKKQQMQGSFNIPPPFKRA